MTRLRSRWVRAMAALVVALIGLGACGSFVSALLDTTDGLRQAGFGSVGVTISQIANGGATVDVSVSVNARPSEAAAVAVARVVWNDLHEHFDDLDVSVRGDGPALHRGYAFGDLVTMFGPRNPAYDRTSVTSSAESLGLDVGIGFVVLLVVVAAVVIVVVVLHRRRGPPPPWTGFANSGGGATSWPPPWTPSPPSAPPTPPPPGPGPGRGGWGDPAPRD